MKLSQNSGNRNSSALATFKTACLTSCRKALAQVARVKEAILAESRATLATQERVLKLALNEAEALATQAGYPHLLFPTLAMEKVQAVAAWDAHQAALNQRPSGFALAA